MADSSLASKAKHVIPKSPGICALLVFIGFNPKEIYRANRSAYDQVRLGRGFFKRYESWELSEWLYKAHRVWRERMKVLQLDRNPKNLACASATNQAWRRIKALFKSHGVTEMLKPENEKPKPVFQPPVIETGIPMPKRPWVKPPPNSWVVFLKGLKHGDSFKIVGESACNIIRHAATRFSICLVTEKQNDASGDNAVYRIWRRGHPDETVPVSPEVSV